MSTQTPSWRLIVAALSLAGILAAAPAIAIADDQHLVQPGDTLSAIAAAYGVTVGDLVGGNGIGDPDHIVAGSVLIVPGAAPRESTGAEHVVVAGENLTSIAARYGVGLHALARANGIDNLDAIYVGEVLLVPGVSPSQTATTVAYVSREAAETALREAAAEFGVDVGLMLALAWQESGWQQHVVSHAGAVGVMQVMPDTAEWAQDVLMGESVDWEGTVLGNARVGAAVLRRHLDYWGGDSWLALAAYYQGSAALERHGPYADTRLYVRNILAMADRFQ